MRTITLSNGLRVIARRQPTLPLLTLDMWIGVGSGDEPEHLFGISHFLEHMLFKGTPSLAVGEYDRRIEGLGGYLNAATSNDYTHYFIEVPSHTLEEALRDFADVLQNSSISQEEVDSERMVILEEIRRKNDDPGGFLYENLARAAMPQGPYSHPVLGFSETVSSFNRAEVLDHYRRFYAADNMWLAVSGDFDEDKLVPMLERTFCDLPRHRNAHRAEPPRTVYAAPGEHLWRRDWKETYFHLGFPAPPVRTLDDEIANDLASTLLSGGRASRLISSVRETQRLVSAISAYIPSHRFDGVALIGGRCEAAKLPAAREAIFAEIARLLSEGLRDGEEARVRRQLVNGHVYAMESNSDVAGLLGYSQLVLGGPGLYTEYVERARTIPISLALDRIATLFARGASSLYATGPDGAAA